ncbi:hypothetical protein UFOVP182_32 [uncultured Caudovirales phage]|uniref:Uncharacterized protein n=1 Tax=uncultured Caudovirales phage TaxID=2100421 RepID=A0A6J7WGJ2_9CAUD|nr:hypothetical protein UFOVP182_32 [uncultured Caudovirales phage]
MRFDWNKKENLTSIEQIEIDSICWDLLKKMRAIDLNSIKVGDIVCTDNGVLQPYNSVVHTNKEVFFMIEYEVDYFDGGGTYNIHFWIMDDKEQILETFVLTPEEVDSEIRNEKLESIGI